MSFRPCDVSSFNVHMLERTPPGFLRFQAFLFRSKGSSDCPRGKESHLCPHPNHSQGRNVWHAAPPFASFKVCCPRPTSAYVFLCFVETNAEKTILLCFGSANCCNFQGRSCGSKSCTTSSAFLGAKVENHPEGSVFAYPIHLSKEGTKQLLGNVPLKGYITDHSHQLILVEHQHHRVKCQI